MYSPWKFVGNDPVRGASLSYNQLSDEEILSIRLGEIVEDGFLFMWIIPSKEDLARSWIEREGFELVDRLAWIKLSRNGNMLTSLGLHFGKCKEEILVARRGNWKSGLKKLYFGKDVLFEVRRAQSEKPKALHELVENNYNENVGKIELFAREHNLRPNWVQVGDELDEDANRGYLTERSRFIKEK